MVVPREEDESSKGQGVREAEEEEEGLKGEEEETEVLEKSKVSFKYIVCLSLKEAGVSKIRYFSRILLIIKLIF